MRGKIDLIIPTCDLYRNVTLPVLYSLKKYYRDMGKVIIVGYKAPDFVLPPNVAFVSMGVDRTPRQWTNGLKRFMEGYSKDYFILHMDDHLLIDHVDSDKIDQLSALLERNTDIDKIMLHPFTSSMFVPFATATRDLTLYKCERGIGATTLMNAIWRRDYLLELLTDNLSPHDFENQNNYQDYGDKLVLSTHNRIMMVTSLMNRGHRNSHRLDIVDLPSTRSSDLDERNRRRQRGHRVNGKVLPVENRHFNHWNNDPWHLDYGGNGSELGAGTVFLLPYYMGLYHGFIEKPSG